MRLCVCVFVRICVVKLTLIQYEGCSKTFANDMFSPKYQLGVIFFSSYLWNIPFRQNTSFQSFNPVFETHFMLIFGYAHKKLANCRPLCTSGPISTTLYQIGAFFNFGKRKNRTGPGMGCWEGTTIYWRFRLQKLCYSWGFVAGALSSKKWTCWRPVFGRTFHIFDRNMFRTTFL